MTFVLSVLLVFSLLSGGCLSSSVRTNCCDADMRVVLASALGIARDAHFRGRMILVDDIREGGKSTLFEVVKREMLAGHYFIPAMPEGCWDDDAWWGEGVRDALTYTKSFFSKQLDVCIAAIAQDVRNGGVCLDGSLTGGSSDYLLPYGKMRRWFVVPEDEIFPLSTSKDKLFIILDGCQRALEGVLWDGAQEKDCCDDSEATHLLALSLQRSKGRACRGKAQEVKAHFVNPVKCVPVTEQKDIERTLGVGPWNVSVMYYPGSGVRRSALFDYAAVGVQLQDQGWGAEKENLFALQEEVLCGFEYKGCRVPAPEDIRVLKRSEVRAFTCERVDWHSPLLKDALMAISRCWDVPGFRAKGQTLERFDLCLMANLSGGILWSIMDECEDLSEKNFFKETVLMTVKGTGVTLRGQTCCLPGCVRRARSDADADMRVVLASALGIVRDAHFRGRMIFVDDIREGGKSTLFEVVKREMLAGHYFIPAVFDSGWDDDAWWSEGVRDALTYTKSFFSEQLDVCIAAIAQACRSLTDGSSNPLLPYGKMCRWSVVPEDKVFPLSTSKDKLFITLEGCKRALEGVLCDRSQEKDCCADSDATHLLALSLQRSKSKACCEKAQEVVTQFVNPVKCVPTAQKDIEHQFSTGPWNVSIMYYPESDVRRSALFNYAAVGVQLQGRGWSAEKGDLSALQAEVLCGFKHKDGAVSAPEDIRALKRPEVRDLTCERVDWKSPLLEEALMAVCRCWDVPGFRAKGQTLKRVDLSLMVNLSGGILWSIMDECEDLGEKHFFRKTVLMTVKGTGVTIKGQSLFRSSKPFFSKKFV